MRREEFATDVYVIGWKVFGFCFCFSGLPSACAQHECAEPRALLMTPVRTGLVCGRMEMCRARAGRTL